jgi:hypothetical protein
MAAQRYLYSARKSRLLDGEIRNFGDIVEIDRSEVRTVGSLISQGILTPIAPSAEPEAPVKKAAAKKAAPAPEEPSAPEE